MPAARHEVVVFDNAGVGRTSAVAAPASLSITAMTSQTWVPQMGDGLVGAFAG